MDRLRDAVLLLAGAALVLFHGRHGWMPLDHSICFDGGYRVLSGEVPWTDFFTPNGTVVYVIQAAFFAVFGVGWWAALLHAALFNGLFCLVVDRLLRAMGGSKRLAFGYALASGVGFYPPIGLPYMEQHSYFFSLLALTLAVSAPAARRPRLTWALVPAALAAAHLSKQIPATFALPVVLLAALAAATGRRREMLGALAVGTLATLSLLFGGMLVWGVDPTMYLHYTFVQPQLTGTERTLELLQPEIALRAGCLLFGVVFYENHTVFGWATFLLAQLGAIAVLFFAAGPTFVGRLSPLVPAARRARFPALLGSGLLLIQWAFAMLTNNHIVNGLPLSFAAAGLLHVGIVRGAPEADWGPEAVRAAGIVLALAVAVDVASYTVRVNLTRTVNDMVHETRERDLAEQHPDLAPLVWGVPPQCPVTARDFRLVLDALRARPDNFFLFGDGSVLYALTGKPSVSPSVWFHPGLSMPYPADRLGIDRWEAILLRRMVRHDVGVIVFERAPDKRLWTNLLLRELRRVHSLVYGETARWKHIGSYTLVDIDRRALARSAADAAAHTGLPPED